MTGLLWSALGLTISAAVLHGAIGIRRPVDRTYLSFACLLAFLAAYLYFEWNIYRASTTEDAIEAARRQLISAHGFIGCILVFVPAYASVKLSRFVSWALWGGLVILFVTNLVAPYGVWFSAPPALVVSTVWGEPYSTLVAPPMALPQYLHALLVLSVFVVTFGCALKMSRHGQRRRGIVLEGALVVVLVHHLVDLFRDAWGGSWPYVGGFGFVTWGLIMSMQLAFDFKNSQLRLGAALYRAEQHAADLTASIEATLRVRDKLNTPLQTLELGLATRTASTADDERALANMRRAIVELSELGRAVERTASQEPRTTTDQERAP
jgi:hypothetical protein